MSQTVQYFTSPSTKLEAKAAAHNRFKYGSPKLRDLVRQQCRVRLKERRRDIFTGHRHIMEKEEDRMIIEGVVKHAISEFEQDVLLQDLIYKELQEEMEQWLIEETNYLAELDDLQEIICPLCQKRPLSQVFQYVNCDNCHFRSNQYPDFMKLGDHINLAVLQHEMKCPRTLTFYTEPRTSTDPNSWIINVICDECDFWTTL